MDWLKNTCPRCFATMTEGTYCPNCGYDKTTAKRSSDRLKEFSLLKSRYLVGDVLGRGGFGITYVCLDTATSQICAVKEFMPSDYSERMENGLSIHPFSDSKAQRIFYHAKEKFTNEAQVLKQLKNNLAVVSILDFFEQNGTAYLVMEYLPTTLRSFAKQTNGVLPPDVAYQMLVMIASALMEIHRVNILHRDITPENIMCTDSGSFKLIDFGAARSCGEAQKTVLLKRGYAPPEQYDANGNQGPWTDIYGLCATYYFLVSGVRPEDGIDRIRGIPQPTLFERNCGVSQKLSNAIVKGMEPDYRKRFQSCKEFLDAIDMSGSSPMIAPEPNEGGAKYGRRNRRQNGYTFAQVGVSQEQQQAQAVAVSPQSPVQPVQPVQPGGGVISGNTENRRSMQPGGSGGNTENRRSMQPAPPAEPTPILVPIVEIVAGPCRGAFTPMRDDEIIRIGRSKTGCELSMEYDTNISRIHCTVQYSRRNNSFVVTDYSTNGTYFEDGNRLPQQKPVIIQGNAKLYLASPGNMLQLKLVKG